MVCRSKPKHDKYRDCRRAKESSEGPNPDTVLNLDSDFAQGKGICVDIGVDKVTLCFLVDTGLSVWLLGEASEQVFAELRRLERLEIIEHVDTAELTSPILVLKKRRTIRLCVDLREPNKVIIVNEFPLPHTEKLLHQLAAASRFSKLDLAAAYHQVELTPNSRELTRTSLTMACIGSGVFVLGWNRLQPHFKK